MTRKTIADLEVIIAIQKSDIDQLTRKETEDATEYNEAIVDAKKFKKEKFRLETLLNEISTVVASRVATIRPEYNNHADTNLASMADAPSGSTPLSQEQKFIEHLENIKRQKKGNKKHCRFKHCFFFNYFYFFNYFFKIFA